MSTRSTQNTPAQRFTILGAELQAHLPHLYAVLQDESNFIELRIKMRADGSMLGILKRHGDDGGPMVLFSNGYGAAGALLGLDLAIQGNAWKVDTPWPGRPRS